MIFISYCTNLQEIGIHYTVSPNYTLDVCGKYTQILIYIQRNHLVDLWQPTRKEYIFAQMINKEKKYIDTTENTKHANQPTQKKNYYFTNIIRGLHSEILKNCWWITSSFVRRSVCFVRVFFCCCCCQLCTGTGVDLGFYTVFKTF